MKDRYCNKEFLIDSSDYSTSSVVTFHGNIKWRKNDNPESLSFLEIANCHFKTRLHRTYDMTHQEWVDQIRRLRDHINLYLDFLENTNIE